MNSCLFVKTLLKFTLRNKKQPINKLQFKHLSAYFTRNPKKRELFFKLYMNSSTQFD